jgi:signal transduction histidine kinase
MSHTGASLAAVDGNSGGEARERLAALGEIAAEVAHELHNVLQVVAASAYVARQATERGDAAGAQPHIAKIERQARLGHAIVDDLMALARGDSLRCEPVLLAEALGEARADLVDGATWVDALELAHIRVRANPALLARVLHVIYENAVHASAPRKPTITTSARTGAGRVVIGVADDGPGVPADIAPRVFEPLVSARPGGTGLGLALARRIVAAHGGSIALDPAGPAGARFLIDLPGSG